MRMPPLCRTRQSQHSPPPPMTETVLHDLESFSQSIARNVRVLLFKHSPQCPISHAAREEYESFRRHNPDVPTMFVDVIDDRAVARGLADACGVRHESPQAIVFEQGKPVWNASHRAITRGSLEAAWGCKC
jgi:bacillithiol system protein YtxJ